MGRESRRVLVVLVYVCVEVGLLVVGTIVYPSMHWSYQNPLFKGGNYRLNVLPGSKLNILCPHVAVYLVKRQDTDNGLSYENFWRVDLKSYETCNVNSSITNNKIFLQCDNPRQIQFETLVFQPFNADPSRVFKKGKVYYFISTSTGSLDSLKEKSNGHCQTRNMKMEIYVCTGPEDANCTDTKPTTKPAQKFTQSTSARSTVRVETTQFTSTKDGGVIEEQRESPSSINGTPIVLFVILALMLVILVISIVFNIYLWRKKRLLMQGKEKPENV